MGGQPTWCTELKPQLFHPLKVGEQSKFAIVSDLACSTSLISSKLSEMFSFRRPDILNFMLVHSNRHVSIGIRRTAGCSLDSCCKGSLFLYTLDLLIFATVNKTCKSTAFFLFEPLLFCGNSPNLFSSLTPYSDSFRKCLFANETDQRYLGAKNFFPWNETKQNSNGTQEKDYGKRPVWCRVFNGHCISIKISFAFS